MGENNHKQQQRKYTQTCAIMLSYAGRRSTRPVVHSSLILLQPAVAYRSPLVDCTRYTPAAVNNQFLLILSIVVVVLTLTRIIKSVVTGQAPVTLELRNTPGKKFRKTPQTRNNVVRLVQYLVRTLVHQYTKTLISDRAGILV